MSKSKTKFVMIVALVAALLVGVGVVWKFMGGSGGDRDALRTIAGPGGKAVVEKVAGTGAARGGGGVGGGGGGDRDALRTIAGRGGKAVVEKVAGAGPAWDGGRQGLFMTGAAVDGQGREWVATEHQGVWMYEGGTNGSTGLWRNFT